MNTELELVKKFHQKYRQPIADVPSVIPVDRRDLRYTLMKEEVEEYLEGAKKGDVENIAKELADIAFALYGTILEHGLQDVFPKIFEEVSKSHMTKDYCEYKMIKGEDYKEANVGKFLEMVQKEKNGIIKKEGEII